MSAETLELSDAAAADLDAISQYTFETFGLEQADAYTSDLVSAMRRAARHPEAGVRSDLAPAGVRRLVSGRHVIYYRPTRRGVFILRILHVRMDPSGRL